MKFHVDRDEAVSPVIATILLVALTVVLLSLIHILRAHETREDLVCRLLLEKKKIKYERVNERSEHRQMKYHGM